MRIAVLDDYQNVALKLADWSALARRAEITVFNEHISEPAAIVERLRPFDVVCVMRERTPLSREIIQQLPQLKLIAISVYGERHVRLAAIKAGANGFVRKGFIATDLLSTIDAVLAGK